MQSPWTTRAQAGQLPASAHGARAYAISGRSFITPAELAESDRAELAEEMTAARAERIDFSGRAYTVADLQRAMAAETER